MTDRPGISGQAATLFRLALGGGDARCRGLYWRGGGEPDGAGGLRLAAGQTVDLGTWFNAAPVGWWRELLGIDRVRLSVRGHGEVTVHRAGPSAQPQQVTTRRLDGTGEIDLPTQDVAWYWLRVRADQGPGRLESATWGPVGSGGRAPSPVLPLVTVVVPTYGREQDALDQVRRLLAPAMSDVVARVVLVDQARTVRGARGTAEVLAEAGDRLLLVEQDNLGGSGGYARGMIESLAHPDDAVLLLDDDARIEPEGLRRMVALAALAGAAGSRTILGTPLLSAERPTQVEALAEGVRRWDFRWGPTDGLDDAVDVGDTGPASWTFADPRAPTDYSGWWATLLPPGAVSGLGLPAPYFLKWDDAEYGLRARRAGYRVATVPGTGAWHPTWAAKGTISSWAAWPLHRNRLATAAAYRAGRGVLLDSLIHQVKHVLSLQYETAELWDAAIAQFLSGPGWLRDGLPSTRDRAQQVLDAVARADSTVPAGGAAARSGEAPGGADGREAVLPAVGSPPVGSLAVGSPTISAGRRQAVPVRAVRAVTGLVRGPATRDAVRVLPSEFTWRTGLGRDVVLLEGADRALVRDPRRGRAALVRTLRMHLQAVVRWEALRRAYSRALPASRTEEHWRSVIGG